MTNHSQYETGVFHKLRTSDAIQCFQEIFLNNLPAVAATRSNSITSRQKVLARIDVILEQKTLFN